MKFRDVTLLFMPETMKKSVLVTRSNVPDIEIVISIHAGGGGGEIRPPTKSTVWSMQWWSMMYEMQCMTIWVYDIWIISESVFWGDPKLRDFWDIKLQIFEFQFFEKCRVWKKELAIVGVFRENLARFQFNLVVLEYFGYKNNSFFRFWKIEKISRNFREIFSKKIALHKTTNFKKISKILY